MARLNVKRNTQPSDLTTHEGAPAKRISKEMELRRSVMACLLWEDSFYESGVSIAQRISDLVKVVKPETVADMAIEARTKMKLRHAPLLLVRELARKPVESNPSLVSKTLAEVVQRADELAEFMSIYWANGKKEPLSGQVKKGLAKAFEKFDAYQLAKYNRDDVVKLRDVLFLCHADARGDNRLWRQLIGTYCVCGHNHYDKKARKNVAKCLECDCTEFVVDKLPIPDTWEVALSAGKDKKETFERLISEKKLGGLALIRILRNMVQAKVDEKLVKEALSKMKVDRILPYRFISAAKHAPKFEPELEAAMMKCLVTFEKLPGKTVLLVDVSGSMDSPVSGKSELVRYEAASGIAILAREICEDVEIFSFSNHTKQIPARHGFALADAIAKSQSHGGTMLGQAVEDVKSTKYDRLIIFTDEQAHDTVRNPSGRGYVVNVAAYKNGVGYGAWNHVDGFSEATLQWIREYEKEFA